MPANYEITLRDMRTANRRSIILWADSFADAEEQVGDGTLTAKYFDAGNEEIIRIDKEYDATSTDR